MSSNLPPGVTESMLPGNRPEDELAEARADAVWAILDEYDSGVDGTHTLSDETVEKLLAHIDAERAEAVKEYLAARAEDDAYEAAAHGAPPHAIQWREQIRAHPVKSCGRLDMATYMPAPVKLGRVESDRVRYVYMRDGSECIVLGQLCDHVAFRAADYDAIRGELEALKMRSAMKCGRCQGEGTPASVLCVPCQRALDELDDQEDKRTEALAARVEELERELALAKEIARTPRPRATDWERGEAPDA